ncbi:ankyrin repeat domain-containing protein [Roseateles chitosanitabidus]|uniref:ankyrin repeat domain-containing protein n=1 Tax=Roseateles chitosanitabidus TaxID=65048 RepID=UPI0008304473|nr:ankyrin repeat domain-containing protein [Roseateles chitosanitabidus]
MPDAPTPLPHEQFLNRLKRPRVVAVALVVAAIVGGVASFTDSARMLVDLVRPAKAADPREELARIGLPFQADAFVAAAGRGDDRAVKLYLDAGMKVDTPSKADGEATALVAATRGRHAEVVKRLLAAHADLSARDAFRMSPLAQAASYGDLDLMRWMLATNPDPALVRNAWGNAAEAGRLEALKLLAPRLVGEQPVLATRTLFDVAALDDAPTHAEEGRAQVAAYLLSLGADPRAVDDKRWTPLHHAAFHGADDVAKQLLDRGAELDARDLDGASPLWLAAGIGVMDTVRLLLDRGANARLAAKDGTTVLGRARYNKDEQMIALLKERGAR